ncbi:MlaD family protein [Limisphaera sp. VF-2]|jgi:phospholipid/cholesterol/gamma-HCH transport system substrate-binding protein|uniref:MlaD family protein n=1 Tax=Limisphaera sp. VF-2 TaxID=3400418 RepID=UPI0017788EB5|nr:MlaD family protein [Limisphaera sp.]
MKDSLETRLGMFVALAIVAGVLVMEMAGGVERFRKGPRIHALFQNALELKVGDRVKMAGVEIGRVEAIQLEGDRVRVTMKLRPDHPVNTECVATIKFTGLMGQNYVSLDFGRPEAPRAADGTILKTAEQPDFAALMARLDNVASGVENLTRSFTGDRIDNLLGPLTDFVRQNSGVLSETFTNLKSITAQVRSGQGTLGRLVMEDTLHNTALETVSNLNHTVATVQTTLQDARQIVLDVRAGQGTLGRLVTDPSLFQETTNAVVQLREILQKINRGDGSVGKLVNDEALYKNARLTLQKLDKATEGLEDQGPLSVVSMLVNTLF